MVEFMNEIERRKQDAVTMMNTEFIPNLKEDDLAEYKYKKYTLGDLAALGVAFEPVVSSIQNVLHIGNGGSGLYFVNTMGKTMHKFNGENSYVGSLKALDGTVGGGQARINPLSCNPTMLFMSLAMLNVEQKLNTIQETQQEIFDYLKFNERAKLKGNINTLSDVMNNYKYNWNNEKYIANKHILVQDIRKDAEQSIILHRQQIVKIGKKLKSLLSNRDIKSVREKAHTEFSDYKLALFMYSYSSFLEVLLLENFSTEYLKSVNNKILDYSSNYRELYTDIYDKMENSSKSTIDSYVLKGLSSASKGLGKFIGSIPIVGEGSVDEGLIDVSNKLDKYKDSLVDKTMKEFIVNINGFVLPFVDNIKMLNQIYNEPINMVFDSNNIYIIESNEN